MTMTLSIKPFGCMPSSAVSDGVQSLITEMFPQAIFLPIETNGDGAVNVYSRVQMQLFKAKQSAEKEVMATLEKAGISKEQFEQQLSNSHINNPLHRSQHAGSCSVVDVAQDISQQQKGVITRVKDKVKRILKESGAQQETLKAVERVSATYKTRHQEVKEDVVRVVSPTLT